MAVYTIQRDSPWHQSPPQSPSQSQSHVRSSYTTTASHYSQDEDPEMTEIPPLRVLKPQPKQVRHSRLPIFKQVRSMLHKAPLTNPAEEEQDLESAKDAFRAAYETPAYGSADEVKVSRSQSPVSVIHDDDLYPSSPPQIERVSPVSPIYASPSLHYAHEHKMRPLQVHVPSMPKSSVPLMVKRKPAPGRLSMASSTYASSPPVIKGSHFSWTTGAPSPTSTRPSNDFGSSIDRDSFQTPRHCSLPEYDPIPDSRFSWTTVGSTLPQQSRPDTPPSPPPPVPTKYKTPPVRSILSRHRPVQRMDREQWTPPRKSSLPGTMASSPRSTTPRLIITSLPTANGPAKKLPPPPNLSPRTHLESLQRQEEDKIHQRKNIQHVIFELSKIQNASPMEVPFSHVRDATRRLVELRATLAEIELEEREIGIAISRARRKEGEEEGLWVRRVTG